MHQVHVITTSEDEATRQLCASYWALQEDGEYLYKIAALAKDSGVRANEVSRIVAKQSHIEIQDRQCPRCQRAEVAHTRSELATLLRLPVSLCSDCREDDRQRQKEEAADVEASMREAVEVSFEVRDDADAVVEVENLSLVQAFALAAIFEDGDRLADGVSMPLKQRGTPVGPTSDYEVSLLVSLVRAGLLLVHPSSSTQAFVWDGLELSDNYYPSLARFYLPGTGALDARIEEYLEQFNARAQQHNWPSHWNEELPAFWSDLAASDCEAYLVRCLARRRLDLTPGNKTRDTIRRGLEWFSLGQMYYFVWRAAASAGDYYLQGDVNRPQAANSAVTRLANNIDKAYAEGWTVSTYQRQVGDEPSMLWHLLTIRALNLKDAMSFTPTSRRRSASALNWPILDSEQFERLISTMVDEAEGYEEVRWLMRTQAPDHGRDVSAVRLTRDSLSGYRQFRVVIQCKHWLSKSLTDQHIAAEVVSIEHWENPPFDVLVVATSGRFTADAVTWVERHNSKGHRPFVELWSDAHLESLLSERPQLILDFRLR